LDGGISAVKLALVFSLSAFGCLGFRFGRRREKNAMGLLEGKLFSAMGPVGKSDMEMELDLVA
jgi:hypothetical protein